MARRFSGMISTLASLSRVCKNSKLGNGLNASASLQKLTEYQHSLPAFDNPLLHSQLRFSYVGAGSGGRIDGLALRSPPEDVPYSILGLNHIAIAVPDLDAAAEHYRTVFGAQVSHPLELPEHGIKCIFVNLGNTKIELIHPLNENSPISNFLRKNPNGGLHHICLTVDDLKSAISHVKEEKVQLAGDGEPKIGAHNNPIVFINPRSNQGVLCELEQVQYLERADEAF